MNGEEKRMNKEDYKITCYEEWYEGDSKPTNEWWIYKEIQKKDIPDYWTTGGILITLPAFCVNPISILLIIPLITILAWWTSGYKTETVYLNKECFSTKKDAKNYLKWKEKQE